MGLADQEQEVGAKHINETEMFQMTSREPMEPIDEEAGVLGDLEDVSESEQTQDTADQNIVQNIVQVLHNQLYQTCS